MIKGSIQENITLINIYPHNTRAPNYIMQILTNIRGEIENTIIVEDFNTSHQWTLCPHRKINKETMVLNDTLHQLDFIDIYRTFHPQTAEYTFFSSAHETFSRVNHTLGHRKVSTNLRG